jgi:hypothetical protein
MHIFAQSLPGSNDEIVINHSHKTSPLALRQTFVCRSGILAEVPMRLHRTVGYLCGEQLAAKEEERRAMAGEDQKKGAERANSVWFM